MSGSPAQRRPLSTYLILLASACIVPFVGLIAYNIVSSYSSERAEATRNLQVIQATTSRQVENYLQDLEIFLRELTTRPELLRFDVAARNREMRQAAALRTDIANLALVDAAGHVLGAAHSRPEDPAYTVRGKPQFDEGLDADGFHVSPPFVGDLSQRWTCVLTYPFLDSQGRRAGTILASLDLLKLSQRLLPRTGDPDLVIGVTHRDGLTLMRSIEPEKWIGTFTGMPLATLQAFAEGRNPGEIQGRDGRMRVAYATLVPGTPWIVGTSVPTDRIFAAADGQLWQSSVTAAILVAVLATLVWLIARAITRPVQELARAARSPAEGLEGIAAPVSGPAEIADAAVAYNQMLAARRSAQAALAESEALYRSVIEQTGQMIFDLDIPTRTLRWYGRAATRQILGCSPEEFSTQGIAGWHDRLHPDDRAAATARLEHSIASGTPCSAEYRLRHQDGTYHLVEERSAILRSADGAPRRLVGRMSDITARVATEQESRRIEKKLLETQKLESLGVLAGGIAHDFNNLLTGILGQASLARYDLAESDPLNENFQQIEKSARRAAELCRQLLAYSGKGRFVIQNVDLGQVVRETAELLAVSISKQTSLRYDLKPRLPAVRADATQLRQIVMNLVINASEAIGDRPGQVTLSTGVQPVDHDYLLGARFTGDLAPGDYVYLEVADNGAGMSRETIDRIFDPFFTTKFTGRGLGLSAVLGIVRGHGGAIKVYSEPNQGTTFKVLLPAVEGGYERTAALFPAAPAWRGSGRILVVDDEEPVRKVAAAALKSVGFACETAADGQEGLELFSREPDRFVAVLIDLTMPRMDGEELFRRMRQIRPDLKVVLMSGFNKVEAINRFTGKGLAGFVQKPFEISVFVGELRRILESAPPAEAGR